MNILAFTAVLSFACLLLAISGKAGELWNKLYRRWNRRHTRHLLVYDKDWKNRWGEKDLRWRE